MHEPIVSISSPLMCIECAYRQLRVVSVYMHDDRRWWRYGVTWGEGVVIERGRVICRGKRFPWCVASPLSLSLFLTHSSYCLHLPLSLLLNLPMWLGGGRCTDTTGPPEMLFRFARDRETAGVCRRWRGRALLSHQSLSQIYTFSGLCVHMYVYTFLQTLLRMQYIGVCCC